MLLFHCITRIISKVRRISFRILYWVSYFSQATEYIASSLVTVLHPASQPKLFMQTLLFCSTGNKTKSKKAPTAMSGTYFPYCKHRPITANTVFAYVSYFGEVLPKTVYPAAACRIFLHCCLTVPAFGIISY